MKRIVWVSLALTGLAGCASQPPASYIVVHNQREVRLRAQITDAIPSGATDLGRVVALFCDVRGSSAAFSERILMTKLRLKAQARGADGVAGVKISTGGGLVSHNCKAAFSAIGEAYAIPATS